MEAIDIAMNSTAAQAVVPSRSVSRPEQVQSEQSFADVLARSSTGTVGPARPAKPAGNCLPSQAPKPTAKTSPDDDASTNGTNNLLAGSAGIAAVVAQQAVATEAMAAAQPMTNEVEPVAAADTGVMPAVPQVVAAAEPEVAEPEISKVDEDPKAGAAAMPNPSGNRIAITTSPGVAVQIPQLDTVVLGPSGDGRISEKHAPNSDPTQSEKVGDPSAPRAAQNIGKPAPAVLDPRMQSLALHARRLQEAATASTLPEDRRPVLEFETKAVQQSEVEAANTSNAHPRPSSAQAILSRQELEQLRNDFAAKAGGLGVVAGAAKNPPPAATGQQERSKTEQDAPREGQSDQKNGTLSGGDQPDFAAFAAKSAKADSSTDEMVGLQSDAKTAQEVAPAVNLVSPGPAHSNASADTTVASGPAAATLPPSPNWKAPDEMPGKGVSLAQLADAPTHSEMRIAMQTDKLGTVELRAHVSGETVGAAITVEKRDAHSILAVELPALRQALSEKSLRVDQVALFQGALDLTSSNGGREQGQQEAQSLQHVAKPWLAEGSTMLAMGGEVLQAGAYDSAGRLNVRA